MDGWMDGWTDGWKDGWMDGWTDGWKDGWMVGRIGGRKPPVVALDRPGSMPVYDVMKAWIVYKMGAPNWLGMPHS